MVTIFSRIFGGKDPRQPYRTAYLRAVEIGRDPAWYSEGEVPDTVDGRFDMIAAVVALLLLRLEREGKAGKRASVMLAELFIQDMDGSVRQMGIGDLLVGKHVGNMVATLGGRLSAFRDAEDLGPAVRRNIFHEAPPSDAAVAFVTARLHAFRGRLDHETLPRILAGEVPSP